uniref:Uncharacterized protein n=1 Tax=Arundo donax TaxID=35708 RepID=A0A0A8Z048_ARUDO
MLKQNSVLQRNMTCLVQINCFLQYSI